jgi:hypothetical protein
MHLLRLTVLQDLKNIGLEKAQQERRQRQYNGRVRPQTYKRINPYDNEDKSFE